MLTLTIKRMSVESSSPTTVKVLWFSALCSALEQKKEKEEVEEEGIDCFDFIYYTEKEQLYL